MHRQILGAFITLVAVAGCAVNPPTPPPYPSEADRARMGTIGLVHASFVPEVNFDELLKRRDVLAKRGAAAGAVVGGTAGAGVALVAFLSCLSGAFWTCHFAWTPVVGGAVVGGAAGSAIGSEAAGPEKTLAEAQSALDEALRQLRAQEAVRDEAAKYAQSQGLRHVVVSDSAGPSHPEGKAAYQELALRGISRVLEMSVLKLQTETEGAGLDAPLTLAMTARARLIDTTDDKVAVDRTYRFRSAPRKFAEWAEDNARPFTESLHEGYRRLAESVVDELFLLYSEPETRISAQDSRADLPFYRLPPIQPEVSLPMPSRSDKREIARVDSLTPTLIWKPFPQPQDLKADASAARARVSNVTYELHVYAIVEWDAGKVPGWPPAVHGGKVVFPAERIYSRKGLQAPHHQVETPLKPCARYFWTYRAAFELDSQPRVTEWAGAYFADWPPWQARHEEYEIVVPGGVGLAAMSFGALLPPPLWLIPTAKSQRFEPSWFYHPFQTPCNGAGVN